MIESEKPDPDALLKAIQKLEEQENLGRLKIFFGMSAGVGKTYAMLEEAHHRLKEGIDLVVGTINTHGRIETEELLKGLPVIPEKWIKYKDTVFEELDLEAILKRKPKLVLVDELAHTNVPGSKHPKRWQDVIELLDAGIDVYTTLNVQHLESRKDIVEGLTGILIRETVPDLILERAASIELIDIPPPELLQRMKEGKVYLGEQSQLAIQNFFKEDNLTALREIALRFTAEKVDHDLHGILGQGRGWKTREKLMVAISSSPSSQQLIRAGRRLAFELDAPWVAAYVDTGAKLSDKEQTRLTSHLNLAQELGAEVVTTHDLDVSTGLQRVAKQKNITRLVIGRSFQKSWNPFQKFQESLIDRLERENRNIDLVILRQPLLTHIFQRSVIAIKITGSFTEYLASLLLIIALTIIGHFAVPIIGYKSIGYIYLLGIVVLSFFVGRGPILMSTLLSALTWAFMFIPPLYTLDIGESDDIALVTIYFFTAVIIGTLARRIREQDQFLHQREEQMENLYEIEREIANSTNLQSLRLNVCNHLKGVLPGQFDILVKSMDHQLIIDSYLSILNQEKDRAAALWVFQNGKIGGWSTNTLPSAEAMYIPIKYNISIIGVLVYQPATNRPLSMVQLNFLQTVSQQLGVYLERYIFEQKLARQEYTLQTEKLHTAIFHSLSHSFYTPLEKVIEISNSLRQTVLTPRDNTLLLQIESLIARAQFSADNIMAISELQSGFVHFDKKKQNIRELIDKCLFEMTAFSKGHAINVQIPEELPLLSFDDRLLRLAVKNLLINAFEYSSPNQPVTIAVRTHDSEFKMTVIDEGPGMPDEMVPFIFEKFYQIPGTASTGMGLGLAIVRSVVDIHQGRIEVKTREKHGTEFSILLPA